MAQTPIFFQTGITEQEAYQIGIEAYLQLAIAIHSLSIQMVPSTSTSNTSLPVQIKSPTGCLHAFIKRFWELTIQTNGVFKLCEFESLCSLLYIGDRMDSRI
ncbi:hypothetical protein [Chlorogloeopsis fritschii]|uniref:hypothetical protein n=1 Tax=Chlorogloeopsis fritschii TaxID=1124 RepID=UPI0002D658C5|nr:hypothetical protein [Chlorogloeopsis fritschii]